ncbi:MAG: hypothetical protein JJT76_15005 [Clostridiaceae bacterium]|nr:hypothetical protein [Clostridiaceae bacterium]
MDMDMGMMMRYHQELYRLHSCLANQHHQISHVQMQIANLNYQMYMHMMNHMENDHNNDHNNNNHSHSRMNYSR